MVVPSLKKQCEEKAEFSTADGENKNKEMEAEKRTKTNNRSSKGKNKKSGGKRAEAAAEEEKPAMRQRRMSARLQSKQWEEKKQLLVRKRVELLDEKDEEEEEEEEEEEDEEGEGEESFNKKRRTKYVYSRRARVNVENAGADLYKEGGEEIKVESGEGFRSGNVGNNGGLRGAEPTNGSSAGSIHSGSRAPGAGNLGEKSAYARVKDTLRLFNKHYLHFVQEEEKRCSTAAVNKKAVKNGSKGSKSKKEDTAENDTKKKAKRPDLKAVSKMMENNEIMYHEKRFGDLPGIDVGHQFYSRCEMVAVGFHSHWLNGIDYMGQSYKKGDYSNYTFPLAVAIVLSGMYEDDLDNAEDVIYTGQGGHNLTGNKRQIRDQVLERGNLALKNSVEQCVPVRVIRGHESASSYSGKVYTYDGLYKVVQYWAEKGISGFTVFKYRLRRMEGQPILTTNQVHFAYGRVPQSVYEIRGLVCEDISGGQENVPIPATNLVDDPPVAPSGYAYKKSIQVPKNVKIPLAGVGCNCKGTCIDPRSCACARLNGGDFPYVHRDGGRLIEPKDVVFECGPNCGCGPGCVNRTSQRGLKYRLEVFRTPKKGWAVRSWDFIPSGAPVCEYVGVLRKTEDVDNFLGNDYIFDIDCEQTMRGLDGRMKRRLCDVAIPTIGNFDNGDDQKSESVPEFCIDAGHLGNIARFINHSCEPNLFVQCVLSSHRDLKLARVLLFAADNIPPLQELTYDYGYALDSVCGPDGNIKPLACYCGVADCRKRLY